MVNVVLAATMASVSFAAEAACGSRDLIGSWSMSVVAFASDQAFVGYCDFAIAADGDLSGSCEAHDLKDSFAGDVSGNWGGSRDMPGQWNVRDPARCRVERAGPHEPE